jgi:hypothetical protein
VVGQEVEFRRLVPDGGVCADHIRPPLVVPMMVEPAPRFPVSPTATQSPADAHEIPVRSTALLGGVCSDQVDPLLEVVTAYGVELWLVPTAMHVVSLVQAMELSWAPTGIDEVGCQVEKFVVVSDVAAPPEATPTATQFVEVAHDNDSR